MQDLILKQFKVFVHSTEEGLEVLLLLDLDLLKNVLDLLFNLVVDKDDRVPHQLVQNLSSLSLDDLDQLLIFVLL